MFHLPMYLSSNYPGLTTHGIDPTRTTEPTERAGGITLRLLATAMIVRYLHFAGISINLLLTEPPQYKGVLTIMGHSMAQQQTVNIMRDHPAPSC